VDPRASVRRAASKRNALSHPIYLYGSTDAAAGDRGRRLLLRASLNGDRGVQVQVRRILRSVFIGIYQYIFSLVSQQRRCGGNESKSADWCARSDAVHLISRAEAHLRPCALLSLCLILLYEPMATT
jgi:hypothetical protein